MRLINLASGSNVRFLYKKVTKSGRKVRVGRIVEIRNGKILLTEDGDFRRFDLNFVDFATFEVLAD